MSSTNGHVFGCTCALCQPLGGITTWQGTSSGLGYTITYEMSDATVAKLAKAIAKEIAKELAQEIEGAKNR